MGSSWHYFGCIYLHSSMTSILDFAPASIVLNRFWVKQLTEAELRVFEYQCTLQSLPDAGDEQRAISKICYSLGVTAVRLGSGIITRQPISPDRLQSPDWHLTAVGERVLSCDRPAERKALETFERRWLEQRLRDITRAATVERAAEGGLNWWRSDGQSAGTIGNGWEVHRGRRIDVAIDLDGNLYLDIDTQHHFHTPWTLHQWLESYPDAPIRYVRNRYKLDHKYISWQYQSVSQERPDQVIIEGLGISLADYHRQQGATEEEVNQSRVVYVKRANQWRKPPVAHLSRRLSPSVTMEMLATVESSISDPQEKQEIRAVFRMIRKTLGDRLTDATTTATWILQRVYNLSTSAQPLQTDGYVLPPAKLLARNNQPVTKTSGVRSRGCFHVGETTFGCLNLYDDRRRYPTEVRACLDDIARTSRCAMQLDSYRTLQDMPEGDLDQRMFWQHWANEGIKTVLVVMPWAAQASKQKIRVQALQAGIATQFMVPKPKADRNKALNVTLGLLCKAGWQPVRLEPTNHPAAADLIIGFDTGTNRELYYGTSAFAVLADGQSLGWELPDVQRGETFSGQAVWQTVSKLILKFYNVCNRYPRKILLMRDGLVQEGEFQQTIRALEEKAIAVDVVGVRKSGAGRMGRDGEGTTQYVDAQLGSVVFIPREQSFLLTSSRSISSHLGSARPLKVVHDYGSTPLEVIALQTYHLTQLHPASGFQSCRLPWVLHLADRSSKEFQRIGQISILQSISREKLIAV
jgi:hypothetical protein